MAREHVVDPQVIHHQWDLDLQPVLAVGSAFFVSEISLPFTTGSSIVWFSVAWAVIGIFWALWWTRCRRLASISLSAEV